MHEHLETIDLSRALIPVAGQDRIVRKSFWAKVRKTLGKVPFLDQAIAVYYAAVDPQTPARARAVMIAGLAYFVMPADLIPDFLATVGFSDDAAVLMLILQSIGPHIKPRHHHRARQFLDQDDDGKPG